MQQFPNWILVLKILDFFENLSCMDKLIKLNNTLGDRMIIPSIFIEDDELPSIFNTVHAVLEYLEFTGMDKTVLSKTGPVFYSFTARRIFRNLSIQGLTGNHSIHHQRRIMNNFVIIISLIMNY